MRFSTASEEAWDEQPGARWSKRAKAARLTKRRKSLHFDKSRRLSGGMFAHSHLTAHLRRPSSFHRPKDHQKHSV